MAHSERLTERILHAQSMTQRLEQNKYNAREQQSERNNSLIQVMCSNLDKIKARNVSFGSGLVIY